MFSLISLIVEQALCLMARAVVGFLQALPLDWVARVGRAGGALTYLLDRRHRRVALRNLTRCFGETKSTAEIQALARENFCRIGESFCCAAKTAAMSFEELLPRIEFVGDPKLVQPPSGQPPPGWLLLLDISGTLNFTPALASSPRLLSAQLLTGP